LTLEEINAKFGDHVELQFTNIYAEATRLELKGGNFQIDEMPISF
jgi:hypothetical protein